MNHNHGGNFWATWNFPPTLLIVLIGLALIYFIKSRTLPLHLRAAFYFGIASALAVIITPIGALAQRYFWCHMVQHMVLMMLSGPLLVVGSVEIFRISAKSRFLPIWRILTHPWISWFSYAGLMIGIHFTGLHALTMNSTFIHELVEVPAYLIVAYLFYYNILDRKNEHRVLTPAISVLMLFFMMVPETLTGFFIYAAPASLYDEMFTLSDQQLGGALMWSGSMILDSIWLAIAVSDWFASEKERAKIIDEEIAREGR